MDLNVVLREVVQYYGKVGQSHTVVLLKGVDGSDRHPFVILANKLHAAQLGLNLKTCRPITLEDIHKGALIGASGPLAWDNTALLTLFRQSLSRITELEAEVKSLEDDIDDMARQGSGS